MKYNSKVEDLINAKLNAMKKSKRSIQIKKGDNLFRLENTRKNIYRDLCVVEYLQENEPNSFVLWSIKKAYNEIENYYAIRILIYLIYEIKIKKLKEIQMIGESTYKGA